MPTGRAAFRYRLRFFQYLPQVLCSDSQISRRSSVVTPSSAMESQAGIRARTPLHFAHSGTFNHMARYVFMSSYLLKWCGEALYGTRWQSELARDPNVTDRTVRRWVEGSSNVPERVYGGLVRLCEDRRAELDELIKVLPRGAGQRQRAHRIRAMSSVRPVPKPATAEPPRLGAHVRLHSSGATDSPERDRVLVRREDTGEVTRCSGPSSCLCGEWRKPCH
jgi:hypothetical protein